MTARRPPQTRRPIVAPYSTSGQSGNRGSRFPRVDHLDTAPLEIVAVSGGNRQPMESGDRGDQAVEAFQASTGALAGDDDISINIRRICIEIQDAVGKAAQCKALEFDLKITPTATKRQAGQAMADLGEVY